MRAPTTPSSTSGECAAFWGGAGGGRRALGVCAVAMDRRARELTRALAARIPRRRYIALDACAHRALGTRAILAHLAGTPAAAGSAADVPATAFHCRCVRLWHRPLRRDAHLREVAPPRIGRGGRPARLARALRDQSGFARPPVSRSFPPAGGAGCYSGAAGGKKALLARQKSEFSGTPPSERPSRQSRATSYPAALVGC